MRIISFIFILTASINLSAQSISTQNREYIRQYKDIAIREMHTYGIPASIKLGQGILESAAGTSVLAKNSNNHFGIKCKKDWSGKSYFHDDDEKGECFRVYETVEQSYEDHSKFLKNSARYAELFTLDKNDYKAWAHGLKKAGYATNPQYAPLLIKTIEENQLQQYDSYDLVYSEKKESEPSKHISKTKQSESNTADLADFEMGNRKERPILLNNRVKYILSKEGDTYESIIKEMRLMSFQIFKYNEIARSASLKPGEKVYLQPKRNKASKEKHTVESGQTMHAISQIYAIKEASLYKLNKMAPGEQPAIGRVLRLK
jgi:LysM repeat protein